MEIVEKRVEDLKPYGNNPRLNAKAVRPVKESILKFGFKVPLVIDKNDVIVCGHTRWYASREIGLETVPCVVADDLTQKQIDAFRLVDNRTSEFADWDFDKLAEELSELSDIDLDAFGFDDLIAGLNWQDTKESTGALSRRFIIPPTSVFDARSKLWQDRKKIWNSIIGDTGQARIKSNCLPNNAMARGQNGVSILDAVLAEIVCYWFTPPGESNKCFDCFAGDTVFGFVSSYLGNTFTGIELRQEQVDFNNSRVEEFQLPARYICDDGRNVAQHLEPESQDFLFSCPPYFDLEVYSDKPNDASNQKSYKDFIQILDDAFSAAVGCLKTNRFAVIVVGDVRNKRTSEYYSFPQDIVNIFQRNGMVFLNEIILITILGSKKFTAEKSMQNRKVVKTHQNVLVFYKGNPKDIQKNFGTIEIQDLEGEDEGEDL